MTSMSYRIGSALLCSLLSLPAQAVVMRADANPADYEAFGLEDRFQASGWMEVEYEGESRFGCGVTLIDERWAITAAHCFVAQEFPNDRIPTRIGFGSDYESDPGLTVEVEQYFVHPVWEAARPPTSNLRGFNHPDLALLYLAEPVTTVTPAIFFDGEFIRDERAHMVGYGQRAQYGDPDGSEFDYRRRGSTYELSELTVINSSEDYIASDYNPRDRDILNGTITAGDSGSGLYVERDGELYLAASASFAAHAFELQIGRSGFMTFDNHHEWIDQTIASVPEPSSLVVLSASTFLILGRRRRPE